MNGVARKRRYNYSAPVDYGYIIIPKKVDRDDYVATCYGRERVTILPDNGQGMIKNCYISREALREINFPPDDNTLGQMVAYITNSFNSTPMIVGVISKESETQLLEEGEFRLEKEYNNSKVSISGKAKTGDLIIDVQNDDGKGALVINVSGKDDSSSLKINVKGDATIYSDDTVNLETSGEINLKSINPTDETFTNLKVSNNKVEINEGSEPILLGTKTVTELDKLQSKVDLIITAINNAAVAAGDGGATFKTNMITILQAAIDANFSQIKSEISFTD